MELGLLEQLQKSKNPRAFISYEEAYKLKKAKVDSELARLQNKVNDVKIGFSRAKSVLGTIKKVF